MSRAQRGRVAVDLSGDWRPYTQGAVPGFRMCGTVRDGEGEGALVQRISNGDYLRWNHGTITRLIQRKVEAAIAAGATGEGNRTP